MNSFVPAGKLKREPFLPSCEVSCAQHCAMDVALEELSGLSDTNALVVGVGECVFYSQKQPFAKPRRNWAFELTDREIVFGDLAEIRQALRQISSNGLTTVCIATCILSVMNLELEAAAEGLKNVVVLPAPDFSGISAYDVLGTLYGRFAEGTVVRPEAELGIWSGSVSSVAAFRQKLNAGTHLVGDRRYLPALRAVGEKYGLRIIDNTCLHPLDFYREQASLLGVAADALIAAQSRLEILKRRGSAVSVKSLRSCDFAVFLQSEGFSVRQVVMDGLNAYAYEQCRRLSSDTQISPDYRDTLTADGLCLDLSPYDSEILQAVGFERLKILLERSEELCR